MDEVNPINIPAFQRKRSLAAKSRKKPTSTRQRVRRKSKIIRPQYEEQFPEIQTSGSLPSEELFPDPLELETIKAKDPEVREMKICGQCEGYFDKIEVAVIKITSPVRKGDVIIFEKYNGLFEQTVGSMQINKKSVTLARSGSDIGIKVAMEPKVGTAVYKVI